MSLRRPLVLVNGLMRALPNGDRVPLSEIGARVRRTTNQTFATATSDFISFQSARWNEGNVWSAGSPTRLTVPVAGKYLLGATIEWANATTGNRLCAMRVNGTSAIASAGGTGMLRINLQTITNLSQNDYVELAGRQESGGNLDCIVSTDYAPEFWIQRIGE